MSIIISDQVLQNLQMSETELLQRSLSCCFLNGYAEIGIYPPLEVIAYEEE